MADMNYETGKPRLRVKAGALPAVRQLKRPDFSGKAADIEKEHKAAPDLSEGTDAWDEAAMQESLAAQESGQAGELDEEAITDVPHWYVAHTYSGYENKVKITLEKTIENRHLENQIFEVRVPLQDEVEVRNGVRKTVSRKMFPGYVLVNMIMNDDTWYVVRNTRGVTGFVGPGSKPIPLTEMEMQPLEEPAGSISVDFNEGDLVEVIAGVWKNTTGKVRKIDLGKQTATINVDLFGRDTPVEISFAELRRQN